MDAVETFSTDAGDFLGTEIGFSAVVADATSYGWDFGDGTSGSGASVSHRFSAVGTYAVTLEVVENGKTTSSTSNIAVRFTQVVRPAIDVAGTGDGDVSGTGGIACAIADGVASGTCQAQFDAGDVIELTATPAPGFVFQGWSGCESPADDVCTHTVTDDATSTANFVETYTLTVRAPGRPRSGRERPGRDRLPLDEHLQRGLPGRHRRAAHGERPELQHLGQER